MRVFGTACRFGVPLLAVVIAAACGGTGDTPVVGTPSTPTAPTTPSTPTPTPTPTPPTPGNPSPNAACDAGNGGITLPPGFCATIFADQVGTARHIAVSASGDVYVMISGGAVLALRDTNADGRSDVRATFGRSGNSRLSLRRHHSFPGAAASRA